MPIGEPIIVVSLFGSALLSAAVRLDADTDMIAEGLLESGRQVVTIDPGTRNSNWMSLQEFAAHVMTRRPGGS